jgi:hypothetical protein
MRTNEEDAVFLASQESDHWLDTGSCLRTMCNQVRETRPFQIGITIVVSRVAVRAEHAL